MVSVVNFYFLYHGCGSHCFLKFTLKVRVGAIIVTLQNEYGTIIMVNFRGCEYLMFIE